MTQALVDRPQVSRLEAAKELLARRQARARLIPFCQYTKPDYLSAHHLNLLAEKLEAVERGEIKRLMVFMPPQHGKSEQISLRFPCWYLGKHSEANIVCASYSDSLAVKHSRQARDIFVTPEFGKLCPDVLYRPERQSQERIPAPMQQAHEWGTAQGGSYYAVGIGGGLTGRGFDIGIIDDPVKDAEEAQSITYRDRAYNWYQTVFRTRRRPGAAIIIVMTRWHEDDLAGRLLRDAKNSPDADQWEVLHLPAINEQGLALWPERYPIEDLLKTKASIGSQAFTALYQGRPSPEEGNIFKREWFRHYDVVPQFDEVIQTWDCAFKDTSTSSWVVGQVWGMDGANKYLLDQVREHITFTETIRAIIDLSGKWPMSLAKLIEDKANGTAVINVLQSKIPGIIAIEPQGGKVVRARAVSPEFEAGNIYIPMNGFSSEYVEEFINFPNGQADDQVDATTQFLNWLQGRNLQSDTFMEYYDPVGISAI